MDEQLFILPLWLMILNWSRYYHKYLDTAGARGYAKNNISALTTFILLFSCTLKLLYFDIFFKYFG